MLLNNSIIYIFFQRENKENLEIEVLQEMNTFHSHLHLN